jgi:hypothetical protein
MTLYNIVQLNNISIAHVMSEVPPSIDFTRVLTGTKWTDWLHLVQRLMDIELIKEPDTFNWNLTVSDPFQLSLCIMIL